MKKYSIIILIFYFLLSLINCTGQNGNPLEIVGTWACEYDEKYYDNKTEYEITLSFKDDGTFDLKYIENQKYTGGYKYVTEADGKYTGEPWDDQKLLTLKYDNYTKKKDNEKIEDNSGKSQTGYYYLKYNSDETLLIIYDLDDDIDQTYIKEKE